jgi:hypothetical protein
MARPRYRSDISDPAVCGQVDQACCEATELSQGAGDMSYAQVVWGFLWFLSIAIGVQVY